MLLAAGPGSSKNSFPGELTDRGRETTLQLGQRLRHLYIHQLGFLPENLGTQSEYYLRYEIYKFEGVNPNEKTN